MTPFERFRELLDELGVDPAVDMPATMALAESARTGERATRGNETGANQHRGNVASRDVSSPPTLH